MGGFLAKEISGVKYMHVRPQHVEVLTDREGPKGDEFLLGPVEQGLEHERVDDEKSTTCRHVQRQRENSHPRDHQRLCHHADLDHC